MYKYTNTASVVISVNLKNDYLIVAFANYVKADGKYYVTLHLQRKDVRLFETMEDFVDIPFEGSDMKSIRTDMANYISELHVQHKFDRYFARFEYEQECFDIGNDSMEASGQ